MLPVAAVKPPVEHKIMGFFELWPKAQFVSEKKADKPVLDNSVQKKGRCTLCISLYHMTTQNSPGRSYYSQLFTA